MEATRVATEENLARQRQLEELASRPAQAQAPEKQYQFVKESCDGHSWRREIRADGSLGAWEDLGPAKK